MCLMMCKPQTSCEVELWVTVCAVLAPWGHALLTVPPSTGSFGDFESLGQAYISRDLGIICTKSQVGNSCLMAGPGYNL